IQDVHRPGVLLLGGTGGATGLAAAPLVVRARGRDQHEHGERHDVPQSVHQVAPFPRSPFRPQDTLSVNSPPLAVPRIRDALKGHAAGLALASDLLVPVSAPLGYTRLRREID